MNFLVSGNKYIVLSPQSILLKLDYCMFVCMIVCLSACSPRDCMQKKGAGEGEKAHLQYK